MEIKGTLIKKLAIQTGEGKKGTWQKQEFIIETIGEYPKKVCFNLFGKKVELIKNLEIGASINVHFNINSREFNDKWYTQAEAWKVDA